MLKLQAFRGNALHHNFRDTQQLKSRLVYSSISNDCSTVKYNKFLWLLAIQFYVMIQLKNY